MEKFYNNAENEEVKFKFSITGVRGDQIESRLVFEMTGRTMVATIGQIVNEEAIFTVPNLSLLDKGNTGKLFIESVYKDQYFKVWEGDYIIDEKVMMDALKESKEVEKIVIGATIEKIKEKKEESHSEVTLEDTVPFVDKSEMTLPKIDEKKDIKPLDKFYNNSKKTDEVKDKYNKDQYISEVLGENLDSSDSADEGIITFIEFQKSKTNL